MEDKIKKARRVIAALSKLAIELIGFIGWLELLKLAIIQLFS